MKINYENTKFQPFTLTIESWNELAAIEAVNSGQAAATLIVGGAPMDNLKTLNKAHKLLSIPEAEVAKLKNVYKPTVLNYSNLGAAGVSTVSVDSVLIVRQPRSKESLKKFDVLKTCFQKSVPILVDKIGTHPGWAKIDIDTEPKWPVAQFITNVKK